MPRYLFLLFLAVSLTACGEKDRAREREIRKIQAAQAQHMMKDWRGSISPATPAKSKPVKAEYQ